MLLANEGVIRLSVFLGLLGLLLLLEWRFSWRATAYRLSRLVANAGLLIVGTAILRLLVPVTAVLLATRIEGEWGVMAWVDAPYWLAVVGSIVILDMLIYWQHRFMHWNPRLWRLHRVHHSDRHLDVTTALRFHPIELVLSMAMKLAALTLLGAPALAVMIFELVLSSCALFNHSNITMPKPLERFLRYVLVTPDLHRIHHSTRPVETNSNYGFSVVWWDWLFASFTPKATRELHIGLKEFTDEDALHLVALLKQPLLK